MRTGTRDLIKQINHSITLNLIKSRGPLSRTDIARLSGLSLATISGLTGELLASGFIKEAGEGESTGGRPPVLLRLNPHGGFVVGIKLTERSIVIALADLEANVVDCRIIPAQRLSHPQSAIASLVKAIRAALQQLAIPRDKVIGIGIGLSGVIDSSTGVCHYSPILGWRDVQLVQPIEDQLGLPVFIENDVNTLTVAEQWFGSARGVNHFLVVTIGRGIGLGIVVNGQFYRGMAGGAGEFGHLTLEENGPLCECGKRGCLEAMAADPAVARMASEAVAAGRRTSLTNVVQNMEHLRIDDLALAASAGDELTLDILDKAGRAFGLGLSYLVNLFNPQLIVMSGEGVHAGEALLGPARKTMREHTFNSLGDGIEILVEQLGDEEWARGAACVVLSELFKHPIYRDERAWLPSRVA